MVIRIFKTNQVIANVFILLLSILLWIPGYFVTVKINIPYYSLFNFFGAWLLKMQSFQVFVASVLVGLQAVFLNYIINEEKLIKGNSHLVGLFYVVLNSAASLFLSFNPIILVNFFVLGVLFFFFKLYTLTHAKSFLFNAGFLIGVGSLIFSPLLVLFPLLWIVLSYLRTPNVKDYFISLFGALLPFVYFISYIYLTDQLLKVSFIDWIINDTVFEATSFSQTYFYYLGVLIVLLVFAVASLFLNLFREVVKTRKLYIIIFLLTVFLLTTILFNSDNILALYVLLSVPFSVLLANFFNQIKREWLAELYFTMLCLGIAAGYFL
ncbi:MAG: hypothetical protein KF732_02285 [Flavobacteriales bacterium]|nr:hypothetical protein [Flavobacteriales bacterium]